MSETAASIFWEMVQDCGPSIYRMQSSCEMYLSQYLAEYPAEQLLLKQALRARIPDEIMRFDGLEGYEYHIDGLKTKLSQFAEISPEDSAWAVETWADALGRPVGEFVLVKLEGDGRQYPGQDGPSNGQVLFTKTAMAAIVSSGGFGGGMLAMLVMPIILWTMDWPMLFLNDAEARANPNKEDAQLKLFLMFALLGVVVGLIGGAAALGAWIFAGGEERPWSTFSVAFGTAFTMVFVSSFVPCIGLALKPIMYFGSVFGATYKSAARGGEY